MKVKEANVEIPVNSLLEQLRKSYFQVSFDAAYATFDPHSLLISGYPPHVPHHENGAIEVFELFEVLQARLTAIDSFESRVSFLLRETAFMHEISHFHDCVTTPAGAAAFFREWWMIFSIFMGLKTLKDSGWQATDTIFNLRQSSNSTEIATIFELYCNLTVQRVLFNGDFESMATSPDLLNADVVWGHFRLSDAEVRVPFYPAKADIDGERKCLLMPLGFRAITEARAIVYQMHVVRSFGQEYASALLSRLSGHEYKAVNMLFTRLAKRSSSYHLSRDMLLEEMYRMLNGVLSHDDSNVFTNPPGAMLVDHLGQVDDQTLAYAGTEHQNIERLEHFIQRIPEYLLLDIDGPWCGYQMRNFVLQCLRETLEHAKSDTDTAPFPRDSVDWYSTFNWKLPQPPLSLQGGRLGYSLGQQETVAAERVIVAAGWVLLRVSIEQIMWQNQIECPVLSGVYSGFLQTVNLHPQCAVGPRSGGCGRCRIGDDLSQHVDCVWKSNLVQLGMVRS